ncbi:unnamed protein product, partial [Adineta steineri]
NPLTPPHTVMSASFVRRHCTAICKVSQEDEQAASDDTFGSCKLKWYNKLLGL